MTEFSFIVKKIKITPNNFSSHLLKVVSKVLCLLNWLLQDNVVCLFDTKFAKILGQCDLLPAAVNMMMIYLRKNLGLYFISLRFVDIIYWLEYTVFWHKRLLLSVWIPSIKDVKTSRHVWCLLFSISFPWYIACSTNLQIPVFVSKFSPIIYLNRFLYSMYSVLYKSTNCVWPRCLLLLYF